MPALPGLSPYGVVLALGTAEGLFLAAMLLARKCPARKANRYLSAMLISLSSCIAAHLLGHSSPSLERIHPGLITFLAAWNAPSLYLYARALSGRPMKGIRAILPGLAGAGAAGILSILGIVLPSVGVVGGAASRAGELAFIATTFGYLAATIAFLTRISRGGGRGDPARPAIHWLIFLSVALACLWLFAVGLELARRFPTWDSTLAATSLVIIAIGNFGFIRPAVFWGTGPGQEAAAGPKYAKSGLPDYLAEVYRDRLVDCIERRKAYADPELSLRSLARLTRVPSHHLSRIINERMGLTFYEYVKSLRLGEARRLLSDPARSGDGIAELCHEAGFNSLSAFNIAFKKTTGQTPSDFRKKAAAGS